MFGCSEPVPTVAPPSPWPGVWLYHSGGIYEPEQREPIHIKFSGTVRAVTLTSTGALKCSGTHGRLIGFRDGVQVWVANNELIDPSDCGSDDVTYGVQGGLPLDEDVDSLIIEGVDPWRFLVFSDSGRALLQYTITYEASPLGVACTRVTRGQVATCRVTGSVDSVVGWQFEGLLIPALAWQNGTVRVSSASVAATWSGTAVLSGVVSALVSAGGVSDTLSDSLVVTDRFGANWRWDETNWTFRQNGPVLCTYTDFVVPGSTRLGTNRRTSGCVGPRAGGSLEPDVVDYPDSGFSAEAVQGGPNSGLWYVLGVHYFIDHTSEMNPFLTDSGRADTLTHNDDLRACRRVGTVVNFRTYNQNCRNLSLAAMDTAIWRHEGFGTKDSLDPGVANGHEARRHIAARRPENDPYAKAESYVNTTYLNLSFLLRDTVFEVDKRISTFSEDHVFVKDNYLQQQGNTTTCGEAWVFNTNEGRYLKIPIEQQLPDSTFGCP